MAHFLHRPHRIPPKLRGSGRSADEPPAPPIGPEPFHPSLDYVLKTRYILQYKVIHGKGLPLEIVDLIIDEAEYWPSVEVKMDKRAVIRQDADRSLVRTLPLCYDEKVRLSAISTHRCVHIYADIKAKAPLTFGRLLKVQHLEGLSRIGARILVARSFSTSLHTTKVGAVIIEEVTENHGLGSML